MTTAVAPVTRAMEFMVVPAATNVPKTPTPVDDTDPNARLVAALPTVHGKVAVMVDPAPAALPAVVMAMTS